MVRDVSNTTLSQCVKIIPIGSVDEKIIEHLEASIPARSGLACRIEDEIEIPAHTYNESRNQYDSKLILKHILENYNTDTVKILGVTKADLFIPIFKYVFGLAQIKGPSSLISLHRLYPQFYDKQPNFPLLMKRVEKTALHELGHTFGLTHCREKKCVMYSSVRIKDTDQKKSFFCPTCFDLYRWYMDE